MDYERLVTRHKDAVYRQMVRYCGGDREDAADVLAEALLRAYRSSEDLREEKAFRNWLSTIGRRICVRLRHREDLQPIVRMESSELENMASEAETPDVHYEKGQTKAAVMRALASVPETLREVIELRDLRGLSGEETAERLGLSLAAQKSRLHRGRKVLREALDRELLG